MGLLDGDGIRGAMRWLAEQRAESPGTPRMKLIDEASRRYDLSPLEVEFLVNNWKDPAREPAQPGA